MAIQSQANLCSFEETRKSLGYIPPDQSNSFYDIGEGSINIFTYRADPEDYRFDILTSDGQVYTGDGQFYVSGDISKTDYPYRHMTVISNTVLSINGSLTISAGDLNVYGVLEIMENSQLIIRSDATTIFHPGSTFIINKNSTLYVESTSTCYIAGEVEIHLSVIDLILGNDRITLDNAAFLNVTDINLGERSYSITDYVLEMRDHEVNLYSQGDTDYESGRLGYSWMAGSPSTNSYIIELNVLYGEAILGDFTLSILGIPSTIPEHTKLCGNLTIKENTKLYVSNSYNGYQYLYPELYIGIIIDNSAVSATCRIYGDMIVDGSVSKILLDRGGVIIIEEGGTLTFKNDAMLSSSNSNGMETFFINGTLIIDTLDQINSLDRDNIVMGDNGKVIILNPDIGSERLLFTTPTDIGDYNLYRLFENHIDHLEIHLPYNTGFGIDTSYDYFPVQMPNWIGGYRIEKAILLGIIKFDNGYIELNQSVIPWINSSTRLQHIAKIFKSYGGDDYEQLQDMVNKMKYVESGNIIFKCIYPEGSHELLLNMDGVTMKDIVYNPSLGKYVLNTDSDDGLLFLRNMISGTSASDVIHKEATTHDIVNGNINFTID